MHGHNISHGAAITMLRMAASYKFDLAVDSRHHGARWQPGGDVSYPEQHTPPMHTRMQQLRMCS